MLDVFAKMTTDWFRCATQYTGSIGRPFQHDFRFRFEQDQSDPEHPMLHAAVYSDTSYELAGSVIRRDFAWDDDGTAALRQWLQDQYDAFSAESESKSAQSISC